MESRVYNFGLLGYGEVATKHHLPAIMKMGGNLMAVARSTDDWYDVVYDPEIDVISICTPNYLHVHQALAAISVAKKVILEKPIAINLSQALRLVNHPDSGNIAVCYQRRFNSVCQRIKAKGRPLKVDAVINVRRDDSYWNTWRSDPIQSGGGNLMNIDIHYLDLLLWWLGDTYTIDYVSLARLNNYNIDGAVRLLLNFDGVPVTFSGSAIHDKRDIRMTVTYPDEVITYTDDDATHADVYSQFLNHGKYVTVQEAYKSLQLVREIYDKA